jgi:16S rRNA (cytidine1402-2'-O)-methyltransferase
MSGMLIVGSMHLGHPEDMSYRMVKAIKDSDVIYTDYMPDNLYHALEHFGMLPESYDIRILKSTNTMFADEYQVKEMVDLIKNGETVLLFAGEGQVGIADPGNQFIQACIEEDLKYTIYPGPSSHITAFVASGITNGDFYISCNMEYPEKTIEYFKDQDTPLVIPIWKHRLDEIIELIDTKFKFTNNKNKKITLCCDMTANEELFITDWADKIAKNEKLKEIRQYSKIMLVVSDFIKQ